MSSKADASEPGDVEPSDGEPENQAEHQGLPKTSPAKHIEKWQFKKGQSGNPKGRPKGKTMRGRIAALLDSGAIHLPHTKEMLKSLGIDPKKAASMDQGELLAAMLLMHGLKGNSGMAKELIERSDGKVLGSYLNTHKTTSQPGAGVATEKEQAIEFYRSVVNSDAPVGEKMRAQQRIDEILGLTQVSGLSADAQAEAVRTAIQDMQDATFTTGPDETEGDPLTDGSNPME